MGQLPGPSYPFEWSDNPPPERPDWWRWFVLAGVLLLVLVLFALVATSVGGAFA